MSARTIARIIDHTIVTIGAMIEIGAIGTITAVPDTGIITSGSRAVVKN